MQIPKFSAKNCKPSITQTFLKFCKKYATYVCIWQRTYERKMLKTNACFSIVISRFEITLMTLTFYWNHFALFYYSLKCFFSLVLFINVVVGAGGEWCSSPEPLITTVRSTLFYFIYLHLYQLKSITGWWDGTMDSGTMKVDHLQRSTLWRMEKSSTLR